ncbi:hypothetical protein SAMN05216565_103505 [Litchfieldia salsa]|uniref:Uncharacterized protein n=1 Tax=Litchfieldia salsa TaxID=930152 RepID=A0A1H0TG56_9BACI|nr:hypothetical protein SAMN05216565_103505 [Litchfieldia salsa]
MNFRNCDEETERTLLEAREVSSCQSIIYADLITISFILTMIIHSYIQKSHLIIFIGIITYLCFILLYKFITLIFDWLVKYE